MKLLLFSLQNNIINDGNSFEFKTFFLPFRFVKENNKSKIKAKISNENNNNKHIFYKKNSLC